ncbi:MAG: tetratricopeptide repeat protein, partial [Elusimicrobiota bacterium]|nr:tetratricopeptide repeat protein [Elusimicrobiota bacterium]
MHKKKLIKTLLILVFAATGGSAIFGAAAAYAVPAERNPQRELYGFAYNTYKDGLYKAAAGAFEEYMEKYPQGRYIEESRLFYGKSLLYSDNYQKASQIFRDLSTEAQQGKIVREASLLRGDAEFKSGRYKRAAVIYNDFIQKFPDSEFTEDAAYFKAESYYNDGNFSRAAENYRDFIQNYPQSSYLPYARFSVGISLFSSGNFRQALPVFKELAADSKMPAEVAAEAFYYEALTEYNMEKYETAADKFSEFLDKFPRSDYGSEALFNRALCFIQMKKFEK